MADRLQVDLIAGNADKAVSEVQRFRRTLVDTANTAQTLPAADTFFEKQAAALQTRSAILANLERQAADQSGGGHSSIIGPSGRLQGIGPAFRAAGLTQLGLDETVVNAAVVLGQKMGLVRKEGEGLARTLGIVSDAEKVAYETAKARLVLESEEAALARVKALAAGEEAALADARAVSVTIAAAGAAAEAEALAAGASSAGASAAATTARAAAATAAATASPSGEAGLATGQAGAG